jgi:hypothetical protein
MGLSSRPYQAMPLHLLVAWAATNAEPAWLLAYQITQHCMQTASHNPPSQKRSQNHAHALQHCSASGSPALITHLVAPAARVLNMHKATATAKTTLCPLRNPKPLCAAIQCTAIFYNNSSYNSHSNMPACMLSVVPAAADPHNPISQFDLCHPRHPVTQFSYATTLLIHCVVALRHAR